MEEKKSQSDDEDSGAEDKTIDEDYEMNVDNNQEKEIEENKEPNEDQSLQETVNCIKIQEQIMRVEDIVTFYKDGLQFMDLIEQANGRVANLFNSRTSADFIQAIDFFVNLRHYRRTLPTMEQNLRLMFRLIWSVNESKCKAITQAFVKICFDVSPTIARIHIPLHQAHAIILFLKDATFLDELDFEKILKQLIEEKKVLPNDK
ncbi:unnamed protein product, partial [Rotaria sp. Silwood2]